MVCLICQRYKFKSKSQQTTYSGVDSTHPDEVGHDNIAKLVYEKVGDYIE